jgi:hypothetical protein
MLFQSFASSGTSKEEIKVPDFGVPIASVPGVETGEERDGGEERRGRGVKIWSWLVSMKSQAS